MQLRRLSALVSFTLVLATLPAAAQNQLWTRQLGTSKVDGAGAATPDGSGGVYVGGATWETPFGYGYAWVVRNDSAGNRLWLRQLGTSWLDYASATAPDGAGGVYVGGGTVGSFGGPNPGKRDAFLSRYDSAGNRLWLRQPGTSASDYVSAAAPDGAGGVYVVGGTEGSIIIPYTGKQDAWLARYDGAGNRLWLRQLGTSPWHYASAAAPDGSGGVYVGGGTRDSLGGANAGSFDAWLARYDSAGNPLWLRQLGTSAWDYASAAAPDGAGAVYMAGWTLGSLGGPNAGSYDAWLARYDSAGNQLWIRQLGTSGDDVAWTAAPDGKGGAYVGGDTEGSLGGPNAGSFDAWLAHYDGAGNGLWILQLGTSTADGLRAAAPDGSGGVYVGGSTAGSLGGPNAGRSDAWLARYDSSCAPPTVYCTAKVNSQGCAPSMYSTGSTSLADNTLRLHAQQVINNKLGLLFWSTSPSALPFQGGYLCTQPPAARTAVQSSGGNPPPDDCSGSLQFHWSQVYVASKGLATGVWYYAQYWSRDPMDPFATSLSDAMRFLLCP
jgi:catechol 2,3-dioxygenase-like lactoylglutathione lyase family enzyme